MGKKSRRQREKDPVNEMVKYQARQTGEGKQQALRRMKEALNSMHPRSAPSVAPAPVALGPLRQIGEGAFEDHSSPDEEEKAAK